MNKMSILRIPSPLLDSVRLDRPTSLRRCRLEECRGACCLHGVWLDPLERDDILAHVDLILPWMAVGRGTPSGWFGMAREPEPAFPSGYVIPTECLPNPGHYGGTECVFLRPDARCALQTAGEAAGEHPWRWKPFHCILHPLTFDDDGRVTLAPDDELLSEEGSCFRAGEGVRPIRDWLTEEIRFLEDLTPE
jgi:hypothetical protein